MRYTIGKNRNLKNDLDFLEKNKTKITSLDSNYYNRDISEFFNIIFSLINLVDLDLTYCSIKTIPDKFYHLKN